MVHAQNIDRVSVLSACPCYMTTGASRNTEVHNRKENISKGVYVCVVGYILSGTRVLNLIALGMLILHTLLKLTLEAL